MQYSHAKAGALGALALFWSLAGCSGNGGGSGPAPTYQVGGTVEGLGAGGTLVVQLNGGNDLTITGDGTFEFPVQLTAGDSYSVTVLSGPGDYVTVQNGIGIAAADVADITIACTSWRIPTDEDDSESPTASDAQDPAVAINALGNAIVVFSQYNDRDESQIFVSALNDGVWHRPTDLTDHISPLGEYAYAPKVAIAPTGDAIVVWVQYDGSRNRIFVATRDGGTWTYPADLNAAISNGTTDAGDCSVAMLPNGDAVVAWEQFDGSFYQIYKSERHAGVWSHPANLADNISPNGQNAQDPFVATAGNGEIVIAYRQYDGSRYRTMKSEFRNAVWSHATSSSDAISPATQHADTISVAMADNGDTLIVWRQLDGSHYQSFKSEYRSGSWVHPANLTDNISPNGQNAYGVKVAMAPNGAATIVWQQYDGNSTAVFKSEYRNGTWTHPTGLTDNITPDDIDCSEPAVAMSNDDAAISYVRYYGSYDAIYVTDYRSGSWRAPRRLSPELTDSWEPMMAMNSTGRAIVAWTAWTFTVDRVFASSYR
ncbi:MAG: hypothetical protein KDE27_20930 [Planctomycetes bacterium]|nr:hypothetical protein [Planctomycetota bacterium]